MIDAKGTMEKQKVFVMFVIDKEGNVTGVKARSASEELQKDLELVKELEIDGLLFPHIETAEQVLEAN